MRYLPLVLPLMLLTSPAAAKVRDFCADRPGLDTPPCTLDPGDMMVEVGLLGWDHSADATSREDVLTAADTTVRIGVTPRSELQLGFTGYVHDRLRDKTTGSVSSAGSTGDAMIAWRRGIAGPNGPVAIQAFVSLPVGKSPGGAGDWGAGVLLPVSFNLGQGFQLAFTPEADAAVNASGSGRHLAFGSQVGLSHPLGKTLSGTIEVSAYRDLDPSGHDTLTTAAASLAWQAGQRFQLDLEADFRIAGSVPDRTIKIGLARRI